MMVFRGHAYLPVELLRRRLDEKLSTIGVGRANLFELCEWAEEHVIPDEERAGYEDDWPHSVVVTVNDDGTVKVEAGS